MRINLDHGAQQIPESNRTNAETSAANAAARSSTRGSAGEDQAQFSGAHTQVQALAAQASQLPEVREARVHALRQAIQSGIYHPGPEQVASAVFSHMRVESAA
jgi:flagellar biosynthesis anti-sigma factor FlgM